MIQYLFSGFELSLYSVYEYHYIFWYFSVTISHKFSFLRVIFP